MSTTAVTVLFAQRSGRIELSQAAGLPVQEEYDPSVDGAGE
jgi:hypothetical protein